MAPNTRPVNLVELSCPTDSKITHVSLYTGLAEVTRICRAELKEGDNKVVISGLPNVLVHESLRVDGRGPCTIHEVSIFDIPVAAPVTTSGRLDGLVGRKTRLEKALKRCQNAIAAVDSFQNSVDVRHVKAAELANVQRGVDVVSEELDSKQLDLEEQITEVTREIEEERKVLGEVKEDNKLRQRVSITVVAEEDCDLEFVLIYAVSNATWDTAYDIYVKMDTKEKAVKLIYKAAILQSTGETWDDVQLALETATLTIGLNIPELQPWTLSLYKHICRGELKKSGHLHPESEGKYKSRKRSGTNLDLDELGGCPGGGGLQGFAAPKIEARGLRVSSQGDINATFTVPGLMTIPSDGASHNVTITELNLDAVMSWVSVPKKSAKAHLTAKIKNESDYTLLSGIASIYVDESFISRSDIPAVSPLESFECPLGIDPTIRIIYHPRNKKVNQPGFTRRTSTYVFSQRITITNTKSSSVNALKIQEQIPASEDETIVVNLTSPALVLPQANKKGVVIVPEPIKVRAQATAQWEGADEPEIDPGLVGKDGKFNWVCSLPSQGKLNLLLIWEVVCPYGTNIVGLDM